MIKINLALRKQPVGGTTAGKTGSFGAMDLSSLKSIKFDAAALKSFPLQKLVLPVIVAVLANFTLQGHKESEVKAVQSEIDAVSAEKPKLQAEANKLKQYEDLKKSLEGDEFTIRTKIDTIRKLIADRSTPPKILLALASTVTEEVWISGFKVQDGSVLLQGYSYGFGPISDFMKNLSESAYFTDLKLNKTEQVKEQGFGEVASFELDAKRR